MATRTISTELALKGGPEFNDAMKSVNNNLKTLDAELKASAASFKGTENSTAALSDQERILGEMVEQQKEKVKALQQAYEEMAKSEDADAAKTDKLHQQLLGAQTALTGMESKLSDVGDKLIASGLGVDQFGTKMKDLDGRMSELKSNMSYTNAVFKGQEDSVAALTAKQNVLSEMIEVQRDKVSQLAEMHRKAANAYGENSEQAKSYGRQLAAERATLASLNSEQDSMGAALKRTNAELRASRSPINLAKAALDKLKSAVDELKAKYPTLTAVIQASGKAIGALIKTSKTMATAVGAASIAATAAMTKLAYEGLKTLTEFAVEAAQNGDPAFAGLAKNLEGLNAAGASAKAALGSMLLPALETLSGEGVQLLNDFSAAMAETNGNTEKMGQVVGEYVGKAAQMALDNLPVIMDTAGQILSGLSDGMEENMPMILDSAEKILTTLLQGIVDNTPMLVSAATDIIGSLLSFLTSNAPQLAASGTQLIVQLIVGLAQALPQLILAIPDIIIAIVDGIRDGWPQIKEAGKQLIDNLIDGIAEAWEKLTSWFKGIWDSLFGNLNANVNVTSSYSGGSSRAKTVLDGSHAMGLDYVPFDGYLAELHRGERVLTAAEASAYRRGEGGGITVNIGTINNKADADYLIARMDAAFGGAY